MSREGLEEDGGVLREADEELAAVDGVVLFVGVEDLAEEALLRVEAPDVEAALELLGGPRVDLDGPPLRDVRVRLDLVDQERDRVVRLREDDALGGNAIDRPKRAKGRPPSRPL